MRRALLLATLLLGACEPFYDVQQEDSIEAYEAYLQEHPNSRFRLQATTRLEELYLERGAHEGLEAYDAYLDKFPEGVYREKAMTEREEYLFKWARQQDTVAAWEKFLAEYPSADKKKKKAAKRAIEMARYRPDLVLSEVRRSRVNLAENPEGPLDGWQLELDVTNKGARTMTYLALSVDWEGSVGRIDEWPVVAQQWPVPMPDEMKAPIKPGQTRTWVWTTREIPADYEGEIRVKPSAVAFVGED